MNIVCFLITKVYIQYVNKAGMTCETNLTIMYIYQTCMSAWMEGMHFKNDEWTMKLIICIVLTKGMTN